MGLKDSVKALAQQLGYTVLSNAEARRHPSLVAQERFIGQMLREYRIDLVIDVGANLGQFSADLRHRLGYTGDILAYEGDPDVAAELSQRVAGDARFEVVACAAADRAGTLSFHRMQDSQFNSLLAPDAAAGNPYADKNVVAQALSVPAVRLDADVPARIPNFTTRRLFLKIDAQGADLSVAEGATGLFAQVALVSVEAALTPLYAGAPDLAAVLAWFKGHDFACAGLYPTNPGQQPWLADLDVYFVPRALLPAQRSVV
jgi:FkbM family methyltransferase